jgi:diphthamide synthase subunit DPH2
MEESVYKDTAEALEESELAIIPKEEFEELIKNNKEVSRNFISLLAKNISNKVDAFLYIGDGYFHPLIAAVETQKDIYQYFPGSEKDCIESIKLVHEPIHDLV